MFQKDLEKATASAFPGPPGVTARLAREVITARQNPWQNPFVERLIGSIRRDCLDQVIVVNEDHLRRILSSYFNYYHHDRTHYGLGKDTPCVRPVQHKPVKGGKVIEMPRVGGLHHRYEWKQAA